MKKLLILTCCAVVFAGSLWGQKTDPYSTPPGAPLIALSSGDISGRLIPGHPGNAGNKVAVSNFVIIESQSTNTAHNMDQNWRTVLLGMGHTANIFPQTTLDNNAFFGTTDALIVSSGIIALTPTRMNTIQQFMQTGKPVYIQGEYLVTYSSNVVFSNVMNNTGGTLTLGATVAGDLVPNSVLNLYSSTPNAVSGIGYHWYGATASGCNRFEYFMRYGANNIGYVYCPTNNAYGDVIQNTDQDWIRSLTSVPLMQNIVFALLSGNACSVVCGVLDEHRLDMQALAMDEGVKLVWTVDGAPQAGRFEVECNGKVIANLAVGTDDGMVFQYEDERLLTGKLDYRVRRYDLNGTEMVSGYVTIDLGTRAAKLRVATEDAGLRIWLAEGLAVEGMWWMDAAGRRMEMSTTRLQTAEGQWVPMKDLAAGIYFLHVRLQSGEVVGKKVFWH